MSDGALQVMTTLTISSTVFFFFNDTATTEIYTLSLHDALPISHGLVAIKCGFPRSRKRFPQDGSGSATPRRSEEHTSELQSPYDLVCRLLLEKKKKTNNTSCTIRVRIRKCIVLVTTSFYTC